MLFKKYFIYKLYSQLTFVMKEKEILDHVKHWNCVVGYRKVIQQHCIVYKAREAYINLYCNFLL